MPESGQERRRDPHDALCGSLRDRAWLTTSGFIAAEAPGRQVAARIVGWPILQQHRGEVTILVCGGLFRPQAPYHLILPRWWDEAQQNWHDGQASNLRPAVLETAALPSKLPPCWYPERDSNPHWTASKAVVSYHLDYPGFGTCPGIRTQT